MACSPIEPTSDKTTHNVDIETKSVLMLVDFMLGLNESCIARYVVAYTFVCVSVLIAFFLPNIHTGNTNKVKLTNPPPKPTKNSKLNSNGSFSATA